VLAELRDRGRWLLVFDNSDAPSDVTSWLPGGGGHVLITSRERGWDEIAGLIEVGVLARTESVAILQARETGFSDDEADQLANELGDLPLAIAQAAGFMAESGMPAGQYLSLLQTRAGEILQHGTPTSYPQSLAAVTQISADCLSSEDPAAAELANLCAFLAPEPIPEDLFSKASDELPSELAAQAADPLAWRQTLARLGRQSLARIDQSGLQMHRLIQANLRDRLNADQAEAARKRTEALLVASNPGDMANPATWPRWAQLMPHLLAANLGTSDNPGLREMAFNACAYLLVRGDTWTAEDLARRLLKHWHGRLGANHENVRTAEYFLDWAVKEKAFYAESGLERIARSRRQLVPDERPPRHSGGRDQSGHDPETPA
jgi:hypothetical protein